MESKQEKINFTGKKIFSRARLLLLCINFCALEHDSCLEKWVKNHSYCEEQSALWSMVQCNLLHSCHSVANIKAASVLLC